VKETIMTEPIVAVPETTENTGFKGLLRTLFQRVFLSYKTTLLGIAVGVAAVVAENLVNSPNKILMIVGTVISASLMLVKEKAIVRPGIS
jgi:hypothetical protein